MKQCSMAGHAEYRSRHPLLLTSHLAVDMLIDILTDRGFNVAHFVEERLVPRQVDMKSGKILSETEDVHSFRITFNKENIRDMAVSGGGGGGSDNSMIVGKTFVPKHLLRGGNPEELTGVLYQHPEKHRGDGQDLDGGGREPSRGHHLWRGWWTRRTGQGRRRVEDGAVSKRHQGTGVERIRHGGVLRCAERARGLGGCGNPRRGYFFPVIHLRRARHYR